MAFGSLKETLLNWLFVFFLQFQFSVVLCRGLRSLTFSSREELFTCFYLGVRVDVSCLLNVCFWGEEALGGRGVFRGTVRSLIVTYR